ncbi:MAG: ATPase [Burkholderiaceae bacterium]|nr:MAG: ATPase [Burkholderiaceae bacterium]
MSAISKPFQRGLVVGKFCPLHKGHELLIERAIASCDEVIVVSYTKPEFESCSPHLRKFWLHSLFPSLKILVIDDVILRELCNEYRLPERVVPSNDDPECDHREFVAWLCWEVLQLTINAVFTSESYGDGFAKVLSNYFQTRTQALQPVKHVCVDMARSIVPISGTQVRSDPHQYRHFLSPQVYSSFVKRICILGGESSGKTTLCKALAAHFQTTWVPEFGREVWERKNGNLEFEDMLDIGRTQIDRELESLKSAHRFVFCDTSPLTTLFYSKYLFNQFDNQLQELAKRPYDLILLCCPDIPFEQDGTRQDIEFRQTQHQWYLSQLSERGLPFHLISGSLNFRMSSVLKILSDFT